MFIIHFFIFYNQYVSFSLIAFNIFPLFLLFSYLSIMCLDETFFILNLLWFLELLNCVHVYFYLFISNLGHFARYFFNSFFCPLPPASVALFKCVRLPDIDLQLTETLPIILIIFSHTISYIFQVHWYFILLFQIYCLFHLVLFFFFSYCIFYLEHSI